MTQPFGDDLPALNSGSPELHRGGFQGAPGLSSGESINALTMSGNVLKIPVSIQVVIGSARIPLSEVAQLQPGATITLDQKLGAPASILVNGREVARGELVVLDGNESRLGITITEVVNGTPADVS
jgi:flagellar motor switch protein FliN